MKIKLIIDGKIVATKHDEEIIKAIAMELINEIANKSERLPYCEFATEEE